MSLTVITALLLCSLSWVSVSGSESQTVEVQSGEDVTLRCSNKTLYHGTRLWFRLVNRTNVHCISISSRSSSKADFCHSYSGGKFSMSNISASALKIQSVDQYDSGLYSCIFYEGGRPYFSVTHLKIKGSSEAQDVTVSDRYERCGSIATLWSLILGAVTVFLVLVIIGLVVKNRKLHTADKVPNPGRSENESSADLNYAAVTFRPKGRRREPEPNVVYAATR